MSSGGRRSGGDNRSNRSRGGGGGGREPPPLMRNGDRRSAADERMMPPPSRNEPLERRGGGPMMLGPPGAKFSGAAFTEAELLADQPRKLFTGRCRLFVGNLATEVKEAELKELFTPHGDISECYLSGKGFAFLRLDTRAHAESAKEALDGKVIHGRQIRVRYAVHGATIKVKELSPVVSNEMLALTFSVFGEVERAIHIVDEKGKPTGEGIIEFERKVSAQEAIAQLRERVFLMTANSRPLKAEFLEQKDDEDGLSEKMLQKTHQLMRERELGPRFAAMNSFEYVYGRRWKELYEYEAKRRQELEVELHEQRRRLDADMEVAYEDYKAQMLREELQRRQEELERLDAARHMREQQRQQQMMQQIGQMGWEPALVDGPMGRNLPPSFGGGRGGPPPPGREMGGGGPQPLFGGGPKRGDLLLEGGGPEGGHLRRSPPVLGGGPERGMPNGRGGPSPQSGSANAGIPDMRKLLQGFCDSPLGRQQMPTAPGGLPPAFGLSGGPLPGLMDRPSPLERNPLDRSPLLAGGVRGFVGAPPPPGARIPPPPQPIGGGGQQPMMLQQMMGAGEFQPPADKKFRHGPGPQ